MRKYDPNEPTAGLPKECLLCESGDWKLEGTNAGPIETYVLGGRPVNLCLSHSLIMTIDGDNPLPEWEGAQKRLV